MVVADKGSQDKHKALEIALFQIEKQLGKGAVMKFGDTAGNIRVHVIPTGCLARWVLEACRAGAS